MDDLKLYARNERDLNALITTVSLFSNDIGMTINVAKSVKLIVCRGKVVSTPDLDINKLRVITDVFVSKGYKYLGLLQNILAINVTVKKNIISKFCSRCRRILSSHLSGHNKVIALNSYAILVMRYSAGILDWNQNELDDIDHRFRKLLTIQRLASES